MGREHANSEHNTHYYQHTTRHGGQDNQDPILALFRTIYKQVAYSITQDCSEEGKAASEAYSEYCKRHVAGAVINRVCKTFVFRKRLRERKNRNIVPPKTEIPAKCLLGYIFVLCGNVPKIGSKKLTQAAFKTLLLEDGARVKAKLPGDGKRYFNQEIHSPGNTQHVEP